MTETKKRLEVTFSDVGIAGHHGTFTYDKRPYMAAPVLKVRALFNRAQSLADTAARAHKMLTQLIGRRPELYSELRPVLVVLEQAAARVPWGTSLDQEIAQQAEARAAEKIRRRAPRFTH